MTKMCSSFIYILLNTKMCSFFIYILLNSIAENV